MGAAATDKQHQVVAGEGTMTRHSERVTTLWTGHLVGEGTMTRHSIEGHAEKEPWHQPERCGPEKEP